MAKVDAGHLAIARARATAGGAIASALAFVRPQAELKGVQLVDADAGASGAPYVGDEDRVRQVLVNLLANAVKFTPEGGTVTIASDTTRQPRPNARLAGGGPWSVVTVSDTGIGIDREHHARIFEAFHQVETGTSGPYTRTAGGTGLGLTISRQLARLMGGDLTVESHRGRGAVFALWLPTARATSDDAAEPVQQREVLPSAADARDRDGASSAHLHVLGDIGDRLREAIGDVLLAYVERLRADRETPVARSMQRSELEDHAPTFLADLAQSLVILAASGDEAAALLRDSTAIQRTVSARHGARRRTQGWTDAAVRRDYEVLWEEIERAVRDAGRSSPSAADRPQGEIDGAIGVLGRLVGRAAEISLAAWAEAAESQESVVSP
jgi:hypothetical protein